MTAYSVIIVFIFWNITFYCLNVCIYEEGNKHPRLFNVCVLLKKIKNVEQRLDTYFRFYH